LKSNHPPFKWWVKQSIVKATNFWGELTIFSWRKNPTYTCPPFKWWAKQCAENHHFFWMKNIYLSKISIKALL
jgi:hypothetical protein